MVVRLRTKRHKSFEAIGGPYKRKTGAGSSRRSAVLSSLTHCTTPFNPARLFDLLLVKSPQTRGHNSGPAKITHYFPSVLTIDDRQATNVVAKHLRCGLVQRLIRI